MIFAPQLKAKKITVSGKKRNKKMDRNKNYISDKVKSRTEREEPDCPYPPFPSFLTFSAVLTFSHPHLNPHWFVGM